jgi:hypothetical protein
MPLYEIKEPVKDYVGADNFDDAVIKFIRANDKMRYLTIRLTDYEYECVYNIKYKYEFTKFKKYLIKKTSVGKSYQPFIMPNLVDFNRMLFKKPNNI